LSRLKLLLVDSGFVLESFYLSKLLFSKNELNVCFNSSGHWHDWYSETNQTFDQMAEPVDMPDVQKLIKCLINPSAPYHKTVKLHIVWTFWNRSKSVKM